MIAAGDDKENRGQAFGNFPGFPEVKASTTPQREGSLSQFERWVLKTSPLVDNPSPLNTQKQAAKASFQGNDRFNEWLMATERTAKTPGFGTKSILSPITNHTRFDEALDDAAPPCTPSPTSAAAELASEVSLPDSSISQPSNLRHAFDSEADECISEAMLTPQTTPGPGTPYEESLASTHVAMSDIDGAMSRLRLRMVAQADNMIMSPHPLGLDHGVVGRYRDAALTPQGVTGGKEDRRASVEPRPPLSPVDQVLDLMAYARIVSGPSSLQRDLEATVDSRIHREDEPWLSDTESDDGADLDEIESMVTPMTGSSAHTSYRPAALGMTPIDSILALMVSPSVEPLED